MKFLAFLGPLGALEHLFHEIGLFMDFNPDLKSQQQVAPRVSTALVTMPPLCRQLFRHGATVALASQQRLPEVARACLATTD